MFSIDKQTDELITKISSQIEDRFDRDGSPIPVIKINKFELGCLELIKDDCPEVAKNGISVATAYCEGRATAEELENARVQCWRYIDKKYDIDDFKTKEVCMVRAVIGTLYAEINSYEVYDSFSFFVAMMKQSGVSGTTIRKYLIEHFEQFL